MKKHLYKELYELEDTHWWHISKRELIQKLITRHSSSIKPKVLDIGSGAGKTLEMLSHLGKAIGVDSSQEAIKYSAKRGLNNVMLQRAEELKFRASSFDIITILDVLEHVDDKKVMSEIARILRPGGIVVITVPAFQKLWSQWDEMLHHKRRYSSKSLLNLVRPFRLRLCRISYKYSFLFIPVFLIRLLKSIMKQRTYSSDFKINSPAINILLLYLSRIENRLLFKVSIPFGTSIICVLKKNEKREK